MFNCDRKKLQKQLEDLEAIDINKGNTDTGSDSGDTSHADVNHVPGRLGQVTFATPQKNSIKQDQNTAKKKNPDNPIKQDQNRVKKRWLKASIASLRHHRSVQLGTPGPGPVPVVDPVHVPPRSIPNDLDAATPVHVTHITNPAFADGAVVYL